MILQPSYCVVLFPTRELVRRECSLREAAAWLVTYNGIMQGAGQTATIVEEEGRRDKETERRRE